MKTKDSGDAKFRAQSDIAEVLTVSARRLQLAPYEQQQSASPSDLGKPCSQWIWWRSNFPVQRAAPILGPSRGDSSGCQRYHPLAGTKAVSAMIKPMLETWPLAL